MAVSACVTVAAQDVAVRRNDEGRIYLEADRITVGLSPLAARAVALSILALTDEGNTNG